MSHGTEGKIYRIDGEAVYLTDFFDPFKSNASLKDKPKLFFVNACRGNNLTPVHQDTQNQEEMNAQGNMYLNNEMDKTLKEADFLSCFSTTTNYYSIRESKNGSWFIQILCDMIEQYKSTNHLTDILTFVNKEVDKKEGRDKKNQLVKMMSTYTSQLTRAFFFSQPINVNFLLIFFSVFSK